MRSTLQYSYNIELINNYYIIRKTCAIYFVRPFAFLIFGK